jgi:plasmid stabilization system protein ParE
VKQYTVIITPTAEAEALAAFYYIQERAPLSAAKWLRGLYKVIGKLEEFAGHGRAKEAELLGVDLRQVVFTSYRVLYTVNDAESTVHVHHIRHGARRRIGEE